MENENKPTKLPEVWMRGPVEGVPPLLQPVAHALLQANEEISRIMEDFPRQLLWQKPGGMASPAFHLQHIPGVLDRLFTYSREEQLSSEQLKYLSEEGLEMDQITGESLVNKVSMQITASVGHLRNVREETLTEPRFVGRKRLPSTVLGLLFHSAEHTMRHVGQLLVTANIVRGERSER